MVVQFLFNDAAKEARAGCALQPGLLAWSGRIFEALSTQSYAELLFFEFQKIELLCVLCVLPVLRSLFGHELPGAKQDAFKIPCRTKFGPANWQGMPAPAWS